MQWDFKRGTEHGEPLTGLCDLTCGTHDVWDDRQFGGAAGGGGGAGLGLGRDFQRKPDRDKGYCGGWGGGKGLGASL